ncbi:hypothetical protein HDV03_000380 [Kappamyces sp. JEL0829]|nr:hypothetical protein HDV03_000380 [Kappamyces sp. JEL0829]
MTESIRQKTLAKRNKTHWARLNVYLSTFIFVVVSTLEMVIVIMLINFINATFSREMSGSSSILAIYFGIFIAGLAFQLLGAIDANFEKNTMQIVAVGLFNFLGVAYAIVQIVQLRNFRNCVVEVTTIVASSPLDSQEQYARLYDLEHPCYFDIVEPVSDQNRTLAMVGTKTIPAIVASINREISVFNLFNPLLIVICVIMCLGATAGVYFAYMAYQQTGWHVFMLQGADIRKKKMIQRYHLFLLFLKLNAFFFLGLAGQYIVSTYLFEKFSDSQSLAKLIVSTTVALCLFVIYYVLGYFGTRRANYLLTGAFILMLMINFLGSAIVLWRIHFQSKEEFRPSVMWLTVFSKFPVLTA